MSDSQTAIVNSVVVYSVEAVGVNLGPLSSVNRFCKSALRQTTWIGRQKPLFLSIRLPFIVLDKIISDFPNALNGHAIRMKDLTAPPT